MSESIIADFTAQFNSGTTSRTDPTRGRVVLSQRRLVLAASEDDKLTIPLDSIFDINIAQVPHELDEFFQPTVTIAFERKGRQLVATVETERDKIEKFITILFKTIINGTKVKFNKKARVGGRVTDKQFKLAQLVLTPGEVEFRREDSSFVINLTMVSDFRRLTREIDGESRPVLTVQHMQDGTTVSTEVALASSRKMVILGRYLRREYSKLMEQLQQAELTKDKKELLVTIYSTSDIKEASLASILNRESSAVSMLLQESKDDGLIQDGAGRLKLTPAGRAVANQHIKDVDT